jgi:predicted permease
MSIGIAANVSVFSIVNGVLLRPLPFPHAEDVSYIGWDWGKGNANPATTLFQYDYMRRHSQAFEAVATYRGEDAELGDGGSTSEVHGMSVSPDFFRVIGINPDRGRAFDDNEHRTDAPVVIVSDVVWRTRLGADPRAVGRSISLNGRPHTVVGIMPASYRFPADAGSTDFMRPYTPEIRTGDEGHNSLVLGRARHDWNEARRAEDLARVSQQFRRDHPELASAQESYRVFTHAEVFAGDLRTTLLVLLGAVMFVLLIGCANTANLMLVRATGRTREIAVRAALGAGRRRIAQQLLTEGLILSFGAALIGVWLGSITLHALLTHSPNALPRADEIGLDIRVLTFLVTVAIATGIIFGLAAAWPALRVNLQDTLREGSRGSTAGGQHARNVLVLAETAMAVVLLAGAGLMMTSFARLVSVDTGFDAHNVVAVRVNKLPANVKTIASAVQLEDRMMQAAARVPGVEAVAVASNFPLERGFNFPTSPADNEDRAMGAPEWRAVSPGYFDALRIPLKLGRGFGEHDNVSAPHVAIVNESLAKRFWPGENPLGKRMYIGRFKGNWLDSALIGSTEVVGVIADAREVKLDRKPIATLFVPRAQAPEGLATNPHIIVRTRAGSTVTAQLGDAITSADPRVQGVEVETMKDIIGRSIAEPRFRMLILCVFAASALLLAAIGIYGVIAASVQQSTREIGVRMALGATRLHVTLRVLRRCVALVAGGAAIGTALALGLTRFLASMLYDVKPGDPLTFCVVIAVLCAVGGVAGFIPARRASRVDPGLALRSQQT